MSLHNEGIEPNLGYRFLPASYPQAIGHPKLEINILCVPSEEHFDPKIVLVPIFTTISSVHPHQIEQLKVFHPWAYHGVYQVAPGLITISDRKGKKVEAYSFGGTMTIEADENCTTCMIQSDAPIVEVARARPAVIKLVQEVEILFAGRRVEWAEDLAAFEARLVDVPVSTLYAVILNELETRYDKAQSGKPIADREFQDIIEGEKQHMKSAGRWPEKIPSVSEIL